LRISKSGGIDVAEGPGSESAIARLPTAVTAFVGRALRGPVNRPITVRSYAEFHNVFGGLWQPSTLSYAVEQFFENGGRKAVIVRVVNGGAPASITLPCGTGETLTLVALSPGSREALRASVDYDNIGANESDRFNLIAAARALARLRAHRGPGDLPARIGRAGHDALRRDGAAGIAPGPRARSGAGHSTRPYVPARARATRSATSIPIPDGDDGAPLTDYDVIGSPTAGTRAVRARCGRGRALHLHPAAGARPRRRSERAAGGRRACAASVTHC
jgi:uncharacterized protein